ncbi:MAG: glycoside hydrolase, partial [Alistipes sp.]|nr:glycoside hydrolase [Alistipes sp.]
GKYYLMMISWNPGQIRREVCYRADCITGPYEKRVILETPFDGYGGVAQGCIVEDRRGEWQALIFQDREGVGRTPCLMPCRWVDGWPMLGTEEGKIPNNLKRKHPSMRGIVGSDSFRGKELSLYWQWNHNPIDEAWSLTERRGALRLRTARVVENLFVAPNTLTQRMVGPASSGIVKMDVGAMKVGDRAGFAAFNGDSGVLTIHQTETGRVLVLTEEKSRFCEPEHAIERVEIEELARVNVSEKIIYLRIDADFGPDRDWATFYYSTDGRNWHRLGRPIRMTFDYRRMFMGTKFALFNYATREVGGWVDLLDFNYR